MWKNIKNMRRETISLEQKISFMNHAKPTAPTKTRPNKTEQGLNIRKNV